MNIRFRNRTSTTPTSRPVHAANTVVVTSPLEKS
jgi:hypothetical protein